MSLFGSYARGEANDDSEVDLYIKRGKMKSLLQYFTFVDELEDKKRLHINAFPESIEPSAADTRSSLLQPYIRT